MRVDLYARYIPTLNHFWLIIMSRQPVTTQYRSVWLGWMKAHINALTAFILCVNVYSTVSYSYHRLQFKHPTASHKPCQMPLHMWFYYVIRQQSQSKPMWIAKTRASDIQCLSKRSHTFHNHYLQHEFVLHHIFYRETHLVHMTQPSVYNFRSVTSTQKHVWPQSMLLLCKSRLTISSTTSNYVNILNVSSTNNFLPTSLSLYDNPGIFWRTT